MKNKFWKAFAGTVLSLLMLFGFAQIFVSGQEGGKNESERWGRSVEGAWLTIVTPRNCQTGEPLGGSFPGMLVFHKGGTLTGTSTAVSSALGVWRQELGGRGYSFASLSFRYNASGVFVGTRKITQSVTLTGNGDEFTTTGTFQDFDVNGNQTAAGCTTSTGTRFE